jgi:membrane-bound metal-dependent hydrolase YbcI (DUF457 family)
MFLGHFAVALAAKKAAPRLSLGTAILAAQWLDLLWPVLLLTGTEKAALAGSDAPVPLAFTFYPYSHSLLFVTFWAAIAFMLCRFITGDKRMAFVSAVLVLSHWVLDLVVHIPDLPLTPFSEVQYGMGLWRNQNLSLLLELFLFAAGLWLYMQNRQQPGKWKNTATWVLIGFLVVIQLANVFGPPPPDIRSVAVAGLSMWLFVIWGYWVDRVNIDNK